jgi:predicted molibdopterin-dependent oxidoreductase YjgC
MGPIESCDTCLVEVDGKLARACRTKVSSGMKVVTNSKRANEARAEAFDVILGNHMLTFAARTEPDRRRQACIAESNREGDCRWPDDLPGDRRC